MKILMIAVNDMMKISALILPMTVRRGMRLTRMSRMAEANRRTKEKKFLQRKDLS